MDQAVDKTQEKEKPPESKEGDIKEVVENKEVKAQKKRVVETFESVFLEECKTVGSNKRQRTKPKRYEDSDKKEILLEGEDDLTIDDLDECPICFKPFDNYADAVSCVLCKKHYHVDCLAENEHGIFHDDDTWECDDYPNCLSEQDKLNLESSNYIMDNVGSPEVEDILETLTMKSECSEVSNYQELVLEETEDEDTLALKCYEKLDDEEVESEEEESEYETSSSESAEDTTTSDSEEQSESESSFKSDSEIPKTGWVVMPYINDEGPRKGEVIEQLADDEWKIKNEELNKEWTMTTEEVLMYHLII